MVTITRRKRSVRPNPILSLVATVKAKLQPDTPNPYTLADTHDQDGWDRATHGLMADAGTDDDVVETKPYEGDA